MRRKGNNIRIAHDGLEAVQVAEAFHPVFVLLDIGLPKLNGYEVARRIRQQPWGRDVILVALMSSFGVRTSRIMVSNQSFPVREVNGKRRPFTDI